MSSTGQNGNSGQIPRGLHRGIWPKGGKTFKSNLQVLCSKCNGRKSNKL
ncbi:MAG: HNH endonuclease [Clostridiales bacterium]|nr:HNH endonuclease [Clostridiales bacterium]